MSLLVGGGVTVHPKFSTGGKGGGAVDLCSLLRRLLHTGRLPSPFVSSILFVT